MKKFVHSIAFGTQDSDLMDQHVGKKFPELYGPGIANSAQQITPVSSLPEPEKETAVAIEMYQYMIELLNDPAFFRVKCALLCREGYLSNVQHQNNTTISRMRQMRRITHARWPFIMKKTKELIEKFVLKFPYLPIAPDEVFKAGKRNTSFATSV